MTMERNLEQAYEVLSRKIVNSKEYRDFLYKVTNSKEASKSIGDIFTIDGKLDLTHLHNNIQNIKFMEDLSTYIEMNDEFNRMIRSSVASDELYDKDETGINKVINTHFIETKYGNIDKEDLTYIDALFPILESIFGLDTIIKGVVDNKALELRFNSVSCDPTGLEYEDFKDNFNRLYDDVKNLSDYEDIKRVIRENRAIYIDCVNAGITLTLKEITKIEDSEKYIEAQTKFDNIMKNLLDVIGSKNNVK